MKKRIFYILVLVLTAALCLSGCKQVLRFYADNFVSSESQKKAKEFMEAEPDYTVYPVEQISERGIIADDVLALYDYLAKSMEYHFGGGDEPLDVKFASVKPNGTLAQYGDGSYDLEPYDYYFCKEYFIPTPIFTGLEYEKTPNLEVYTVYFEYIKEYEYRAFYRAVNIGIGRDEMAEFLAAYGHPVFETTMEWAVEKYKKYTPGEPDETTLETIRNDMVGRPAAEGFTLDRECIRNANEEQLWATYNLVKSIVAVNFHAENALPDKNYEIVIPEWKP